MDAGWLNTPEGYFQESVNFILTSVYEALMEDDRRRFNHAEIYFFKMWWD